jgi:outer membrane protein assembly factor BamA
LLGDSTTLRGWNKYDVAPTGGDSMFHMSVEYQYRGLAFFTDAGSVWDRTTPSRIRAASGIGFHFDNFFATYGVSLNGPSLGGTFMIGVRF